jgi:DNA-binding transcriptional ArsR family regulator
MSVRARNSAATRGRVERSAPVFAALGDQTRLRVVMLLCGDGPASIARLTAGTSVTRQAVTKHLHVLEGAGLVRSARMGRESVWRLNPDHLDEARRRLSEISGQWDKALARLRTIVEE